MATSTRVAISLVSSLSRWFRNLETVALETLAARATSAIVARAEAGLIGMDGGSLLVLI